MSFESTGCLMRTAGLRAKLQAKLRARLHVKLRPGLFLVCVVMLMMTLAWQGDAMAQSQEPGTRRLVKLFDFEEAAQGNYEDLPQHWYVIGRPALTADSTFQDIPLHREKIDQGGYPKFTQVRFNRPQHEPGDHSFMMRLDGGNVGAYLEVGAVPAIPLSEYMVSVRVTTDGLKRASARMKAYLLDRDGRVIPQSVSHSPLVRSQGSWRTLHASLSADFENAAWIGVELELLQQQPDPDSPLGREQVIIEDIDGRVWWDDLAIWQLPQVSVNTQSPVNIVRSPQRPRLSIQVRDVTGHELQAHVTVHDLSGREVARTQRVMGHGSTDVWAWEPKLPGYGWYLADLTVHDTTEGGESAAPGGSIARSLGAFLYLPEDTHFHPADAWRFMMQATDASDKALLFMPKLMAGSGLRAVTLSLWDRHTTQGTLVGREKLLDDVINPIVAGGGEVSLSISSGPQEMLLKMDLDHAGAVDMFRHPRELWQPYMLPLLMRHGQTVKHWQLGLLSRPLSDGGQAMLPRLTAADEALKGMTPEPVMRVPWSIHASPEPARRLAAALAGQSERSPAPQWLLDVPPAVQAERVGSYLASWDGVPVWLHLREPGARELSRVSRANDLALRMVHGWEAGVAGLSIPSAWAWTDEREKALMPDSLLGVFSQVGSYLSGRRAVGRLDLGSGLRCVIFDGPAGGLLVMWNESAAEADVAMYLGQRPVMRDLFGNRQELVELGGVHRLRLERSPVFIEGIDANLARLHAAFMLDDSFIESSQVPHERMLTITNPWPQTMTGMIHMVGPEGWRFSPASTRFSIPAHGRMQLPVKMSFPPSEVAGHKQLTARLVFHADQAYDILCHTPIELGLQNIRFDATVSYTRSDRHAGLDAVVTQFITNTGDHAVSLYAFVQTPGFARQEGIISRLKPGESIIRHMRIEDVTSQGRLDQPLRVGLRETRGPAVLNKLIRLQPPVELLPGPEARQSGPLSLP